MDALVSIHPGKPFQLDQSVEAIANQEHDRVAGPETRAHPCVGNQQMDDGVSEMARERYGYGRWDAPYWFIGLEEGMGRDENDDLLPRVDAWRSLGKGELNDCIEFHNKLGETRWHRKIPSLQPTWRQLILLLMAFTQRPTDKDSRRNYQRDEWGTVRGETCLIELSGISAPNLKTERDRISFGIERTGVIRERLRTHIPKFVVMYGTSRRESWELIAGRAFPPNNMLFEGPTILAVTKHPTSRGSSNVYWEELAANLRQLAHGSVISRY